MIFLSKLYESVHFINALIIAISTNIDWLLGTGRKRRTKEGDRKQIWKAGEIQPETKREEWETQEAVPCHASHVSF